LLLLVRGGGGTTILPQFAQNYPHGKFNPFLADFKKISRKNYASQPKEEAEWRRNFIIYMHIPPST
jgi:hypothetical protein